MKPSPRACPSDDQLLRVTLGSRSDAELAEVERHLDACADCRRVVAAALGDAPDPDEPPVLASGARVGQYRVERLLGSGGMGVVYAAHDETLGRRVALKLLRDHRDPHGHARLAREAQTMARLSHPNLVPVFELAERDGQRFLVMELVDGLALHLWLAERPRTRAERLSTLIDAGRGLTAAHAAGVVHRDFKPGNVLIGQDGRVRVGDFGLSRAPRGEGGLGAMLQTQAGALVGTPAYMSPEQLAGSEVDARSDQFSFCVTFVEAFSGRRPFEAPDVGALASAMRGPPALKGVPRAFRSALRRGLALEREQRFPSMQALLEALLQADQRRRLLLPATAVVATLGLLGGALVHARTEQFAVASVVTDLQPGMRITPALLTTRDIPKSLFSNAMIKPDQTQWVMGKPVIVPVFKGDVLLWTAFAPSEPDEVERRSQIARESNQPASTSTSAGR